MASLAELFVGIRDKPGDLDKLERRVKTSLDESSKKPISPQVNMRDAQGRLRNARGHFVKEGAGAGKAYGKSFGGSFGGSFGSSLKNVVGVAAVLTGVRKAVGFLAESNDEAREAQKVGRVTAQIIKATGGVAKVSAGDVDRLTRSISLKTGVDDEAIQAGSNLLLTFKNVRNETGKGADIFDRANRAAVDLSATGFGSITGSSKMLGKALNDPVKGISALGRAGVTFTQGQKDQIKEMVKNNDVLGAQKIILKEVESQVGGTAAASATAGEKMRVAYANVQEQLGTALLPIIDKVAGVITTKVLPAVSGFISGMGKGEGPGGRFAAVLTTVKDNVVAVGRFLYANREPVLAFGRMFAVVGKSLSKDLGGVLTGEVLPAIREFGRFLARNQGPMVNVLQAVAMAGLDIGKAIATGSSLALRVIGMVIDSSVAQGRVSIKVLGAITTASAAAFGWIPGIGPKLREANEKFLRFGNSALDGMEKAGRGAKAGADGIDQRLLPSLNRAQGALEKVARTELVKARLRDSAVRAAQVIQDVGTKADGSQLKLKKWSDTTKLGADEQKRLRDRIQAAKDSLGKHLSAVQAAKGGQDKLTKAWESGKKKLYDEFKQMGLSNKEARKLAERYAGVKPKVKTAFETPGLPKAQERAKKFDETIENTKGKKISIKAELAINASAGVSSWNKALTKKYGKSARLIAAAIGGGVSGPGTGTSDSIPALLSNGEHIWTKKEVDAVGGHKRMIQMRKDVLRRAAGGPVEAEYSTSGYRDSYGKHGAFGRLADLVGSKALAGNNQRAKTYFDNIGRLMKDSQTRSAAAKKAADAALASSGAGGKIAGRKVPGGWGPIYSAMRAKGARSFNTYAGHHPSAARARDVYPHSWAAANAARALSSVWYVIYRMKIASKNRGNTWRPYHPTNRRGDWQHVRHIHVARYADGGPVGLARGGLVRGGQGGVTARIGEGRNDELVTPLPRNWKQMADQESAGLAARSPLIGEAHWHVNDVHDGVGELAFGLRRIDNGGVHVGRR